METFDDNQLAARIADTAGKILLTIQSSGLVTGKAMGEAGDAVANAFILQMLKHNRPGDALLSEEEAADPKRLDAQRVWVVDPLDGTREFSETRSDWAVHVALTIDGTPAACAVALPGLGQTLTSAAPNALKPVSSQALRILVSRTRPPAVAVKVAELLGAELVPMGSAGAKAMAVLRGEADAYLHAEGQYEWDSAAPVGVAHAAGLHVSRIDGSPMRYNQQADPYLPDILVCRKEFADQILQAIAQ